MKEGTEFVATAPGRICLFGEHQDYLGLPVIAAAIGVRLHIDITIESPLLNRYKIVMPDIGRDELINTAMPLVYQHPKDYLRSAVKVVRENGFRLPNALTAIVRSEIPIAAGTSSSTALTMAWITALLHSAEPDKASPDPLQVARYSHACEVLEFKESGGMMDQLSIGYGGVCYIDFAPERPAQPLKAKPEGFVLGDSKQPKDTQAILSRVRGAAEGAIKKIKKALPPFDLKTTPYGEVEHIPCPDLTHEERKVLLGNIRNRDLLRQALDLLSREDFDPKRLGALLTSHHAVLRDAQGISTPKIEGMMDAALEAGALGGKINGSGGGGCMFVLAPGREGEVARAIEKAGGKAYPVSIGDGIRVA
jgi:galactokinase